VESTDTPEQAEASALRPLCLCSVFAIMDTCVGGRLSVSVVGDAGIFHVRTTRRTYMREQELPYGHTVIGFDSVEEMNEYMAKQEQDAVERTLTRQWEIGWGSYVIRLVEDLVIWAHIFTEEESLELERN